MKRGPQDPFFFEDGKGSAPHGAPPKPELELNDIFRENPKPLPQEEMPDDLYWSDIGKFARQHPMYGNTGEIGQGGDDNRRAGNQ